MKFLIVLATTCIVALSSCQSKSEKNGVDPQSVTKAEHNKIDKTILFDLDSPVLLDSSEYVMYPLPNTDGSDGDESGGSYGSSGRTPNFWNIIFYNTATKKYHLLTEKRKMIIKSYNTDYSNSKDYSNFQSSDHSSLKTTKNGNYIFYSIIIDDLNKDGKLNDHDPDYLFISDREGNNFKQISPDNFNVKSWVYITKSDKVLIHTVKNSVKDQTIAVPYIYDLKKGGVPDQVFSTEFNQSIGQLHEKFWPAKK